MRERERERNYFIKVPHAIQIINNYARFVVKICAWVHNKTSIKIIKY